MNAVGRRDVCARVIAAVAVGLLWLYWPELGVVVAGSVSAGACVRTGRA